MAGRTKENIENKEAERTKEAPSKLTRPRLPVGAMNKDRRFHPDKFAVIPRGSIDSGITNLRKDGAYDIRIIHVPTDKSVTFPAALTSFSDGTAASFSSETYYGRMDPAPIYSNTTRTITLGFDVISYSEAEAKHNLRQMNLLQSFMYRVPRCRRGATTIKSAPLLRVKLANLICDAQTGGPLLCYTQQVSFDPDFNTYGAFMDGANLIPKMYTVTLSLNILHEHTLGWGTNGFGNGIGSNFPRRLGVPQPPSTTQEQNSQGVGVEAGTPAAVDPNADCVAKTAGNRGAATSRVKWTVEKIEITINLKI